MQTELQILLFSTISIAFFHTIAGPDHYIPFIALSKVRGWSFAKTLGWTVICGCGHVWSSILLGLGGAALGWKLQKITGVENVRGGIAGWALVLFGLLYGAWGLYRAFKNKPHKHFDTYEDGSMYVYEHKHGQAAVPAERHKVTPWVMFIIFLLGPCEPMIPLLFVPAVQNSWYVLFTVILVYTLVTLIAMCCMVILGYYGLAFTKTAGLNRFIHALGGLMIFICGAGMLFMGW